MGGQPLRPTGMILRRELNMLPKALSRLTSKSPAASTTVRPADAAAGSSPIANSPGPDMHSIAPEPASSGSAAPVVNAVGSILSDPSIHDDVEAGYDVRRALRTRLERLEASLDPMERRGDALTFFERISKSGEKTVRQPRV